MRKIPAALNAQFDALLVKNKIPQKFRPVRLHVRLCNTRKRKELSQKHEMSKTRTVYQQLDSIVISILDTDYSDGHGLGSIISEIRVRDFF